MRRTIERPDRLVATPLPCPPSSAALPVHHPELRPIGLCMVRVYDGIPHWAPVVRTLLALSGALDIVDAADAQCHSVFVYALGWQRSGSRSVLLLWAPLVVITCS